MNKQLIDKLKNAREIRMNQADYQMILNHPAVSISEQGGVRYFGLPLVPSEFMPPGIIVIMPTMNKVDNPMPSALSLRDWQREYLINWDENGQDA